MDWDETVSQIIYQEFNAPTDIKTGLPSEFSLRNLVEAGARAKRERLKEQGMHGKVLMRFNKFQVYSELADDLPEGNYCLGTVIFIPDKGG